MKQLLPNILTTFRLLLVPLFCWAILYVKHPKGAILGLLIFIVAAITDYYDGKFAREHKTITNFGKIMDPIADKVLVSIAILMLSIKPVNFISIWILLIVLFREVVVTIMRGYYIKRKIYIPANIWGKLKTVFQMIGIIGAFLFYIIFLLFPINKGLQETILLYIRLYFWITALVTILSGLTYFIGVKYEKSSTHSS